MTRTVKQLIKELKKYPEDLLLITSADDEGNYYNYVHFESSKGKYLNGEFYDEGSADIPTDGEEVVCIN